MVLLVAEQAGPLREATTFRRHIAGAESNVAIGVARLGGRAAWISRVGDDELGQAILFRLRGEGVDTSRVVTDPSRPTGVFLRERREVGPIEVLYYRRGSAASALSVRDVQGAEGVIGSARFLHLTGITPALSESCREAAFAAAEVARSAGVCVVLDPNLRRKLWTVEEARPVLLDLASRCQVLLPGLDEAEALTGESQPEAAARALLARGSELVIVKLGASGALAVSADGTTEHVHPHKLGRVIDPVGAGDAFAAGYLAGRGRGLSQTAALELAARCGALATTVAGDVEGFPFLSEVADPTGGSDVRR